MELGSGKGASFQLRTPTVVNQTYLGSSQGRRRTQTPPSRTQGSGHLKGREQSKGIISIHPSNSN